MHKTIISAKLFKLVKILLINYFIFSFILCLFYLIAPLLGGIFSLTSAAFFLSHSGMAVFYFGILKAVYNTKKISLAIFSIFVAYSFLCAYLWFELKTAVIVSIIYFFFSLLGYMKYKKRQIQIGVADKKRQDRGQA